MMADNMIMSESSFVLLTYLFETGSEIQANTIYSGV